MRVLVQVHAGRSGQFAGALAKLGEGSYTQIVARRILITALLGLVLHAQAPPTPVEPPEEDESLIRPEVYEFNPLQSKKELTTGDFYAKKGNTKAAAAGDQEA